MWTVNQENNGTKGETGKKQEHERKKTRKKQRNLSPPPKKNLHIQKEIWFERKRSKKVY